MKESAVKWLISNLKKIELTGQNTDEKIENYKKQRQQIIEDAIKLENELMQIKEFDNRIDTLKYLFCLTDEEIQAGTTEYEELLVEYIDVTQAFKESISFMQGAVWYRQQIEKRL